MSAGPTRGPVQRPGEDRDFTELFGRVEDLERFPPGRWIWFGTYPTDPNTTPDSPAFANGWFGTLRFRRNSDWSLDIEGSVTGGASGTVVGTLNEIYRPTIDLEAPGVGGSWLLRTTGELIFYADSGDDCDACAEIAAHIADTEDAHMASAIGYLGSSDLPRDNVQDAIDYLLGLIATGGVTSLSKSGSALLTGAVTLSEGSGVTLTQTGQDIAIAASGGSGGYLGYISVQDQKAVNTNGGTPSAASYNTRVLNTEVIDTHNDCSLASNQMTLAAGTYECLITAPIYAGGHHKLRLRNVTDSTTVLVGSAEYAVPNANAQTNRSMLTGRFTIAASKALEVQHYIESAAGGTIGLGAPTNATEVEVYTMVTLWRVS